MSNNPDPFKHNQPRSPQELGPAAWLERIQPSFPRASGSGKQVPADDLGKMRWMFAVDRRYAAAMRQAHPGQVSDSVVQDLQAIAADYQALLDAPMPERIPVYTPAKLRSKLADTYGTLAQACKALHDYEQARQHYTTAIEMLNALGQQAEAQRYQTDLERLDYAQSANVDREISRLHQALAGVAPESLDHAGLLVELGEMHRQNGDDFEAEQLFLQAEQMLDRLGGEPTGEAMANSLIDAMLAMSQDPHQAAPTAIENSMQRSNLYRMLSVGLSKIYRETNPTKAAGYRAKAVQRDSRAVNDAFSQTMLDSLDDLFKNL